MHGHTIHTWIMSTAIVLCDDACCFGKLNAGKCCASMWSTTDKLVQMSWGELGNGNHVSKITATQGILDDLYHGLISEETNRSGSMTNVHRVFCSEC